MSINDDANRIFFVDFPVQVISGNETENVLYHNVLLKKLPDGNFVIDSNEVQLYIEDETLLENSETTVEDELSNFVPEISQDCEDHDPLSLASAVINERSEVLSIDVSLGESLEGKNISRSYKYPESKPGVRYYNAAKLPEHKGPGRPRKDGIVKPRAERMGPFKCSFCDKEFKAYVVLRKHERQHLEEKAHQCNKCSASFNLMSNYHLHMAMHESGTHRCPVCQKTFNRLASLRAHLMLHSVDDNPSCTYCGASFNTQALLENHEKTCREYNPFYPKVIIKTNREQISPSSKRSRPKIKSGFLRLSCGTCLKCFKKPSQLERHIRIHTGEKPYKCQICGRAFSQKGSLLIHKAIHTGKRPYSCTLCPSTFAQKGNLHSHQQRVHPHKILSDRNEKVFDKEMNDSSKRKFACQKCSCIFNRLGSLNSHMNKLHPAVPPADNALNDFNSVMSQLAELHNVAGDKDILQQALNNSGLNKKIPETSEQPELKPSPIEISKLKEDVKRNMSVNKITVFDNSYGDSMRSYVVKQRKVGGVKWRQCNFCTREFKKPSDLVRHLRTHTKEKPFKCQHCYRRFTVKSTLTAHLKTHTVTKAINCSTCQKTFVSTSSLIVHKRIHTGVKPFKCQICKMAFRTSGMLQNHRTTKCSRNTTVGNKHPGDAMMQLEEELEISMEKDLVQSDSTQEITDVHGGSKLIHSYCCDYCTVSFKKMGLLKEHLNIHSADRPFKCNLCDKSFEHDDILTAHVRTHAESKLYKCSILNCDDKFNTPGALNRHIERHNEHKNFMCPYCEKTFKTKANCKNHMQIHKNNRNLNSIASNKETNAESSDTSLTSVTIQSINPFQYYITSATNNYIAQNNKNVDSILPNDIDQEVFDNNSSENIETLMPNINDNTLSETIIQENNIIATSKYQNNIVSSNIPRTIDKLIDPLDATEYNSNILLQENLCSLNKNTPININTYSLINGNLVINNLANQSGAFTLLTTDNTQQPILATSDLNNGQINLQAVKTENLFKMTNNLSVNDITTMLGTNNTSYVITQASNNILNNSLSLEETHNSQENNTRSCDTIIAEPTVNLSSAELLNEYILDPSNEACANSENNALGDKIVRQKEIFIEVQRRDPSEDNSQLVLNLTLDPENIEQCTQHVYEEQDDSAQTGEHNFLLDDCSGRDIICETSEADIDNLIETDVQDYNIDYYDDNAESAGAYIEIQPTDVAHNESEEFDSDSDKRIKGKAKTLSISEQAFLDYVQKQSNNVANDAVQYPNRCNYCVKSFKKPSDLTRHIRTHTGERPFCCSVCHRSFSLKTSLDCHMLTHSKSLNKNIVCSVCSSTFSTKGSLKVHMRLHTGSRPFKCPLCDMSFRTSGHKKAHLLSHYRGAFREGKDPKDIITRGNKILHIMAPLTNLIEPTSSNEETVVTTNMSDPLENESKKSDDKSIDYRNSNTENLNNAEVDYSVDPAELDLNTLNENIDKEIDVMISMKDQTRRKQNRQRCTTCGKSFMKPSQLARHKLIHTGERPYKCDVCSKAFNQKNALLTHLRHHTGVRPHECPYCAKSFTQKGNLKTHIKRTHDNISSYTQKSRGKEHFPYHQLKQEELQTI